MNKKVYCHTTCEQQFHSSNNNIFLKDNWYIIFNETSEYYIIYRSFTYFYKTSYTKSTTNIDKLFSDYFYTEQEYNRIKSLNELLNEY